MKLPRDISGEGLSKLNNILADIATYLKTDKHTLISKLFHE